MKAEKSTYEELLQKVTELKEEAIFLRLIAENSSEWIVIRDKTGKIKFINNAFEQITGYKVSDILKGELSEKEIIHPDDYKGFINIINLSIDQKTVGNFEFRIIRKDGKQRYMNLNTKLVFNQSKFIGNRIIIRDITDRIVESNELIVSKENAEESELQFRLLFENLMQGFALHEMIYDKMNNPVDYKFILVNKAFEKITGLKMSQIIGKTVKEVLPNTEKYWIKNYGDVAQTGKPLRFEDFSSELGKYYDVMAYSPKKDFFAVIFTDVTENKNFEKKLIEAKEQAEESERKLRISEEQLKLKLDYILSPQIELPDLSLIDIIEAKQLQEIQDVFSEATGVASIITDQKGNPITNPSNLCRVCALIRQTAKGRENCFMSDKKIGQHAAQLGKPAIEQCYGCGFIDAGAPIYVGKRLVAIWLIGQSNVGKVDRARIESYADEIGADKKQLIIEYEKMGNMPLEQFKKFTNLLWILVKELSSFAYNNILLAKKIEEQKEYETNLINAKVKAEESEHLKTAFLQNISHEIRTPMNAIIGFSAMIDKFDLKEEKRKSFINIIQNNCQQLLSIVTNVLTISSVETKQEKVNIQKVCVNDIIVELLSVFKAQAFNQNISLFSKKQLTNQESEIYTDKTKLIRILTNLISNALKFTHVGYIEYGYYLVETLYETSLQFYVKDSGIGIKPELQEKIFERFLQADMSVRKRYGGTGLGLAISKAFVELLGGKIWVESEPDKGSSFYFVIPYKPVNCIENIVSEVLIRNNLKTILIAEDEEYNYLFFEELLMEYKLNIIHAKNGQEAVEISKSNKDIGLILMDIKMPIMDGITATKAIKEFRPDLPIVAQTAYALESEINQIIEFGFDGYLTKPIDHDKLFQMISKYMVLDK